MFNKTVLVVSLFILALSVFAWSQSYLTVPVAYKVSMGKKSVEMGIVEIKGRQCVLATRGDAIAIDCD